MHDVSYCNLLQCTEMHVLGYRLVSPAVQANLLQCFFSGHNADLYLNADISTVLDSHVCQPWCVIPTESLFASTLLHVMLTTCCQSFSFAVPCDPAVVQKFVTNSFQHDCQWFA